MAHKKRRNAKPYLHGQSSPIHDEYFVTSDDVVRAINNDPDLDAVEKMQAIKKLAGLKGSELTAFLNIAYKKAYGVDVNTTTPLAEWARKISSRRKSEKKR